MAIKDVATVKDTHEIQTNVVRVDGKRQVYVPIYRQPGANTIEVVKGIKRELNKVLDRLPNVIAFKLVADQSIFVRQAINSLSLEVLMGTVLAGVMVFVFLGNFKATFAALLAIPLSIFACAIGLRVTGETLNTMTLGGIALAVGILIDTSIVVLENISRHLTLRRKGENAVLEGASEVAAPVLAATTTIAIVFLPVVFLSGIGKFLFTPLAKSVVFAIIAAYFVSMTLVPLYCNRFLSGAKMQHRDPRWYTGLLRLYDGLLGVVLRRRVPVVLAAMALFALSLSLYPKLGKELFPRADVGHISMIARMPTGLRIELTEDVIADIEKAIRNLIEPKALGTIISNIGVLYDWPAAYTPNSGPSDAFIEIELTDERTSTAEEYAAKL
ncbi:MAG: efflux RND transporter permease subunit, partial [SAR324 cluster bacterium]|nr:efflux RND transporter permease subunit [SAR324 cluster bacterium]